jgi:hypothetical protein
LWYRGAKEAITNKISNNSNQ